MSEELESQRLFSLKDLLEKPNLVLETRDNLDDLDEDEDDQVFGYSDSRNVSNAEMLKYLNLEDDCADDNESDGYDNDDVKITPCGSSFEKQKSTMEDISGEGKIFKSVKRAGVGDVIPSDAMAYCHYMGYFEYQDEPFDSTYLRQSSHRFRLNRGEVILGLEAGIRTMKKHEIAHFIIHPDYAYGERGCPPRILPNEEVMFSVCLEDFVDNAAADTYENLDAEEKKSLEKAFPRAMAIHATANDNFNRNRIKQAVQGYRKVTRILERVLLNDEEEQEKQQKALTKAYVNLGVCYNKLKEPRKACVACKSVPLPNAKASFTLGKALMTIGEFDAAMREMHEAKKLEPNNVKIVREIKQLNEKMRLYKANEKELWSRCLNVKKADERIDEFVRIARKMCEDLLNNSDLLRQPLPAGLDERELRCFREEAAALGLFFTQQERYGQTSFYICKPDYENRN